MLEEALLGALRQLSIDLSGYRARRVGDRPRAIELPIPCQAIECDRRGTGKRSGRREDPLLNCESS